MSSPTGTQRDSSPPSASGAKGRTISYGWIVAAMVFLSMALAVGTSQYAVGIFIAPLQAQFKWSRTQINGALSLFALGALVGPLVGRLMDRYGVRRVMAVSALIMGASYLVRPLMTELWQWYALAVFQYLAFPGLALLPVGKLIGAWFTERRGRVTGLALTGANFGGLALTPLVGFLVTHGGWRVGYLVLGVLCVAAAPLFWLLVRDTPAHRGGPEGVGAGRTASAAALGYSTSQALRTRAFWAITFALGAATFTYHAVQTQVVPHLENVGMTPARAAGVLSAVAVFGIIGKGLFGYLTDRFPARYVLMLSLGMQAVALTLLVAGGGSPLLWLIVPVFGVGFGAVGALLPLLFQATFGLRQFGSIYGLGNMASIVSASVGPLMVGLLFDTTGTYAVAFMVVVGIFLSGILALTLARAAPWERTPPGA